MTDISPINGAIPSRDAPGGMGSLTSEDFIRIIFTELSHQDPFQPSDSSALLQQLNSIRSIESDIKLMDRLQSLVVENRIASATSMIGRDVQGLDTMRQRVVGTVIGITRQDEAVTLQLSSGQRIPIEDVEAVR
jgi:flagellar basal-body rod modification protein FlgD